MAGASVALALREQGCSVQLIDPLDRQGSATPAAAGMLAPLYEADATGPLLAVGAEAARRYPGFLRTLERLSGESIPLATCGMLVRNRTGDEHDQAAASVAAFKELGHAAELLSPDDAVRIEPAAADAASYLWLPDHAFLDARALAGALPTALSTAGARLERADVVGIVCRSGVVRGVRLADGTLVEADRVVVASGAWSGLLDGLPRPVPVRPIRGEIVVFEIAGTLSCLLADHAGRYLVPFGTGRALAGSTMEDVGFDASVSRAGGRAIHEAAVRLAPGLPWMRKAEHRAGLRPVSADGLPLVGPDPELEGLWYATGYGRGGILLAPLLGACLAAEMAGEPASASLAASLAALHPSRWPYEG